MNHKGRGGRGAGKERKENLYKLHVFCALLIKKQKKKDFVAAMPMKGGYSTSLPSESPGIEIPGYFLSSLLMNVK